jgi:hypothetical protein
MILIQGPAGGQSQGILFIRHFSGRCGLNRLKLTQAAGELVTVQDGSSWILSSHTGPVQALILYAAIFDSPVLRSH